MPLENLEEEGLPKNPDLRIAQLHFLLSLPEHRGDAAVHEELITAFSDNRPLAGSLVLGSGRLLLSAKLSGGAEVGSGSCRPHNSERLWLDARLLVQTLEWQLNMDLLNKMKKANEEVLKRFDEELEDAEKNLGESEIQDAMMAKPEYLCWIGDKWTSHDILLILVTCCLIVNCGICLRVSVRWFMDIHVVSAVFNKRLQ
ncbi:26S proteasome non-ATPase regulatory subunit 6 [Sciurus carolinensis]|uniref:26S proteasome non-ATPase regulatory subunit 6 n=1 Tax=Sciurus carolinensis TaxID=30640 RepID=A0AA41SQJ4_SCICA|nr:26S proteasome non-ATPase regulatory subunit 6 [Sciurus carolinensis]